MSEKTKGHLHLHSQHNSNANKSRPTIETSMSSVENPILFVFNFIGSLVCHQLPERTLWVGGHYLPVCARDTGAYIGLFLGYTLLPLRKKDANGPPNLFIVSAMALPMIIDAGTQWIGLRTSTNEIRLVTGLFFGASLAPLLVYLLSMVATSRKIPVLRNILPKTAELDSKNPWIDNKSLGIGSLAAILTFSIIASVTGSTNPLSYWSIGSLIIVSVIWHLAVLPISLVLFLLIGLKQRLKDNKF